eukprot:gene25836-3396_t
MDYDSNDAHQALAGKNIHFQPKVVPPGSSSYIYTTRDEAAAACSAAGYPRLCRKEELAGFEHCAYGWTSDWEGYWMSSAIKGCGNAGFNPTGNATRTGPAGAYCCSDTNYTPCPTCYFANAALPVVKNGVECFKTLLVPPSKLVLAFPWYGYDYTCQAGDTARDGQCHANSSTPHFFYTNVSDGALHRVDYDDSQSLRLKYGYAKSVGARGTGMWTASALDYNGDQEMGKMFWEDLKVF